MKLEYHADTGSLFIEFSERPSVGSREITEVVVVDDDAQGWVVGIDIDNAGNKGDLERVLLSTLPDAVDTEAAQPCGTTKRVSSRRKASLKSADG